MYKEGKQSIKFIQQTEMIKTSNFSKNTILSKLINSILCIVLFIIPIIITPYGIESIPYNLVRYIVLLSCGGILSLCLIFKRKQLKFDLIDKTLLVFLLLIIISTIFSINLPKAILGEDNRFEGLLTFMIYFLAYYCAKYYFLYDKRMGKFAVIITCICSIIGMLQYYNLFPIYTIFNIPYKLGFASSTFGNRNFFGSFLAIVSPLFMALYITKKKKIYFIVSLLSFWGILISMTRSSWIGLAVASIIGLIYIIKNFDIDILKRTLHLAIGFILIFIFVLFPPKFMSTLLTNSDSLEERFSRLGDDLTSLLSGQIDGSTRIGSGRIRIWEITLKVIAQRPLLGTGPDTLYDSIRTNAPLDYIDYLITTHTYIDKAHNEYLQIAATIGIPALIIYLAFLMQIIEKQKDVFKNPSTLILFVPILSYIVQAFFNISTIGVAPIFWILLGLIQNERFKMSI